MDDKPPEKEALITTFTEITTSSRDLAISYLVANRWNLNAAILAFTETEATIAANPKLSNLRRKRTPYPSLSPPSSSDDSSSDDDSPWKLARETKRRRYHQRIRRFSDLSGGNDGDSDEANDKDVEGENSEMLMQDPEKAKDVDNKVKESAMERLVQSPTSMSTETVSAELSNLRRKRTRYPKLSPPSSSDDSSSDDEDSPWKLAREIKRRRYHQRIREANEHNVEGENSEMLMQDPEKGNELDDKAKESAMERLVEPSRSMSTETVSAEPHDVVMSTVTIWRNGYTVDDSQFKSLDNPENAAFLEYITKLKSPQVLLSPVCVHIKLIKREENFPESQTLAGSESASTEPPLNTTQPQSMDVLVVDPEAPTTSIQLKLADGTRLVTQFNTHHTVRDVRGFIDASRPDGSKDYELLIMGFPPTPLPDFDQTIEKAGIANSVLIQKF